MLRMMLAAAFAAVVLAIPTDLEAQAFSIRGDSPCMPATAAPQAETVGGAVGTAETCNRSDGRAPRITRAAMPVTNSAGQIAVSWTDPTASAPAIILTPAAPNVTCALSGAATVNGFSAACTTQLDFNVTTVSGGGFSGSWSTSFGAAPISKLTPIAPGGAAVTCEMTTVTATTYAGRCWTSQSTSLTLGGVTAGLTVNPNVASAAGINVGVSARGATVAGVAISSIAIPTTQAQ